MTDAKRELEKLIEESDLYCPAIQPDIYAKDKLADAILEKFVHKDEILEHVEIDEEKLYLEITDWQTKHEKLYGNTGILQGHRKYLANAISTNKEVIEVR